MTEPIYDTECLDCGWKGRRPMPPESAAEYEALSELPDFLPSEILGEWFGDCPGCGEPLVLDLKPTTEALYARMGASL